MVMLEPTTRPVPRPPLDVRHPSAFVVSTEHPAALRPLTAAIEAHGVFVEVVEPGPWLLDDGHVLLLRAATAREGAGPTLHDLLPLEIRGDDVINRPATLQVAGHANLTATALAEAGVPALRGRGCSDADDAVDAAFVLGFPVAVRALPPLAGGAVACRDADALWEHVDALARTDGFTGVRVQEWVDDASDIHVLVVGGRAAGASLAVPSDDGHRAAWSPLEVGGTVRWLAEAAVRAVGGDVMAAHLLTAPDGRVVVADVDGSPPPSRFPAHVWERAGALVGERVRGVD